MARNVLHMQKSWVAADMSAGPVPSPVQVCELARSDELELGGLMWRAFQCTADDEYHAPGDADGDAADLFSERWGPVVWPASFVACVDRVLVAAAVVVFDNAHDGLPLLAFALTDPAWQRRGIGQRLIANSVSGLDAMGVKELHLAVAPGNPAVRFYERLGFAPVV